MMLYTIGSLGSPHNAMHSPSIFYTTQWISLICPHTGIEMIGASPPYEVNSVFLIAYLIRHPYMAESHLSESQNYIKHKMVH